MISPYFSFDALRQVICRYFYTRHKKRSFMKMSEQQIIRICQESGLKYRTAKVGKNTYRVIMLGDFYYLAIVIILRYYHRKSIPIDFYNKVMPFLSKIDNLSSFLVVIHRKTQQFCVCLDAIYSCENYRKGHIYINTSDLNDIIVDLIDTKMFYPQSHGEWFFWNILPKEDHQCDLTRLFNSYLPIKA